jgi:hypothetical protein
MPETPRESSGAAKSRTERAISHLVKMNPRSVTVTLNLPIDGPGDAPTVTLEWTSEDKGMPLTDLLKRIEAYAMEFNE